MQTLHENIITELENRIAADCKTVDRESHFDSMLNECYDFKSVGGPFEYMRPSDVLKECDPTAYRCGVNDCANGEPWVEVDGETYDQGDCEEIKEALVDELESAADDLDEEISDIRALDLERLSEGGDAENETEFVEKQKELDRVRADIEKLNKHSF